MPHCGRCGRNHFLALPPGFKFVLFLWEARSYHALLASEKRGWHDATNRICSNFFVINHPLEQSMQPPVGRVGDRGGMTSSGQQNWIIVLSGRQNLGSSPNVVTCILSALSISVYALIDLGSTLLYITPFVVGKWGKEHKFLWQQFEVSTPVG